MRLPISYKDDRARAEQILLEAARKHSVDVAAVGREAIEAMRRRYVMKPDELDPRVYLRLTDNWVELSVRFITFEHGIREVKDAMSREVIAALDEAEIGIASATSEIVGLPPIRILRDRPARPPRRPSDVESHTR